MIGDRKRSGFWKTMQLATSMVALCILVWNLTATRLAVVNAQETMARVQRLDTAALPPDTVDFSATTTPAKHAKVGSRLLPIVLSYASLGDGWQEAAAGAGMLVSNQGQILVEISFDDAAAGVVQSFLQARGTEIRHYSRPGLMEAWLPPGIIMATAAHRDVHFLRPALLARPVVGNSLSQGVAAANTDVLQAAGIDGSGLLIANIDGGYTGYASRQATGDWPTGGSITTFDTDGGGFGANTPHGTATLEINYDTAPGATFLAYEITTRGDWYSALIDASTVQGADVASVSMGMPLDGIGDGTALPGSIAEASGSARSAGMLVVNAAGNERDNHWGGLYNDSTTTAGTHDWGAGGNLLTTGGYCYSTSSPRVIELFWDDWTNVDHDYDLYLYQLNTPATAWVQVASSTDAQNGGLGQAPQEYIAFTPTFRSGNCPVGYGYFSILVAKVSAASDRNLQVFTDYTPSITVTARSLGFPADSPNVFTAAAIDVGSSAQENYSSEGPVLGLGGSLAASSIGKPDAASFANVDTEAYGPGIFNGTSSATPHVAGMAALLLQNNPSLTVSQLEVEMRDMALAGSNDLGSAGFDTAYGYGRVRLPDSDLSDSAGSFGVAWHAVPSGGFTRWLGISNDTDTTAQSGTDDAADDGLTRTTSWVQGQPVTLTAVVGGGSAFLVAWVDWSGDGDFWDSGEEVISQPVAVGANVAGFNLPGSYATGSTVQARFRLYTAAPASAVPAGHAIDGEVEDYQWSFTPTAVILLDGGAAQRTGIRLPVLALLVASMLLATALITRRKVRSQRESRSQRSIAS